jgi:hypothetical protein
LANRERRLARKSLAPSAFFFGQQIRSLWPRKKAFDRNENRCINDFIGASNAPFMKFKQVQTILAALASLAVCGSAPAQSSVVTYQGSLKNNGTAANERFDFVFALFDAATNGTQQGASVTNLNVSVTNGLFTTAWDFGTNAYAGGNRWLDISVRTNGATGAFTPLVPRQPITAAPLAIHALTGNPGPPGVNGTNGAPGLPGTTGQNAITVFGTSDTLVDTNGEVLLPGLTQTVTVPTNSVVYLATDGSVYTTSTAADGFSEVKVYLKIDGVVPADGGYGTFDIVNNGSLTQALGRWSLSLATTLTPGSHTIEVYAYTYAGSAADFSGGNGSPYQGQLTVMFLKQ